MDEWHYIDLPVRFPSEMKMDLKKANITFKPDDALGTLVNIISLTLLESMSQSLDEMVEIRERKLRRAIRKESLRAISYSCSR